jgi:hypothetical protein
MNPGKLVAAVCAVLGLLGATFLMADVITAPPLSGNFAFTLSGFELVTPSGSSAIHLDLKGEGLVTADGNGNLTGNETFTAANPATTESGPVAAQCAGSLAGTVTEPGDGTAQIQLQFTPTSTSTAPTGVGAQDACIPTAMTLSCVEVLQDFFPPIERVGGPVGPSAVATPVPPLTGGPGRGHRHRRRHPKPKMLGGGASGAPIPLPIFFGSGANELKCVATNVTTTATIGSLDGASLSFELQQTAPASVVVPPPCPECMPPPCLNCPPPCPDCPTPVPVPEPTPCAECVPPPCLKDGCPGPSPGPTPGVQVAPGGGGALPNR